VKEVLAVIRMNKMNETKQALVEAGIASSRPQGRRPRRREGRLPAAERRRGRP